jgi:hypothetical protein
MNDSHLSKNQQEQGEDRSIQEDIVLVALALEPAGTKKQLL